MPTVPGQQDIKSFADEANKPAPAPAGVTGRSIIDFAADVEREQAERVAASMDASSRLMLPELAARVSKIKSRAPLPEDFILRNYGELERQVSKPNWNFREFVNTSPTVTDYIIDSPSFAGMSPDAIRAMGNLEDLLRRPKLLWPKQRKQIESEADAIATEKAKQAMADQPLLAMKLNALDMTDLSGVLFKDEKAAFNHFRAEALKDLEDEESLVASEDPVGAGEVFSRRSRRNPAWWAPYAAGGMDVASALELYGLASAVQGGKATPEQLAKFQRIARVQAAEERRGYSVSARATEILMGLPSFAGELATSAGIAKGVQSGVVELTKGAVKDTLQNAFSKALGYGTGKLVQAAGPMAARSLESATRFATPQGTPRVEGDKVEFDFTEGDPWSVAIPKGIVDTWIEVVSEDAGGLLKWMDAPINKLLYNAWTPRGVTKTAKGFQEYLSKAGIHGMFAEMGEEEVGKLMRHVAGLEPYKLPTGEELAAQALAFSVPGALGAAANRIGRREPAKTNPAFFKAIGDYAAKAIEETNAPEVVEAVVKDAARSAGVTTIYADKDAWDEKWDAEKDEAGKPIGGRQAYINIVGSPEGYDNAKGADIPIPVEKYAVHLAATDKNSYWQDELKVNPEEENEREAKERQESEDVLEQSPEGLEGEAYTSLVDKQVKAAKGVVSGLAPGVYTVGGRDVELLPGGKAVDPTTGDEIDLAAELLPTRYTDESGNVKYEPGKKIGRKAKPASEPKPGVLTRIKEAVFGKPPDVQQDIQQQLMEAGNTRSEAVLKAKQFDKVFTNVSRLAKVDKGELFRKFRPTIQKARKARQNAFQSGKKGSYTPGEGEGTPFIELLRKADPSTFLHESAHLYLDMVGYLSSQAKVDPKLAKYFQDVLNWFGVKDVAAWNAMSFEEKRPYHEQFAKGFEAYLFEGKAPSLKLKEAFYQFAAWLRKLYRSIKSLGVELTPEVRSIYDRLLATEEEIEEAKNKAHLTPEDPAKAGLTEAQALEINNLTAEADQAAHEYMVQRAMKQYTRAEFKRRENLRAALRASIEKEFNADPGFRALTVLQTGKEPGGEAVPEALKGLTISRDLGEQVAGRETVDSLPSTIFAEGGVHPDIAAGLLGFKSGRDLLGAMSSIQALGSTPEREAAIRQELDRLDQSERALRESVLSLKSEEKEANKDIAAGREKIAKRLERAMKDSERASIRGLSEILKGIRSRGGIIPAVETKRIPPRFLAGKQGGILSDMLAQELADRGVISDADSETLYDFLQGAIDAQAAVKERLAAIPEEAKKIAAQTVGNLPNIIIDNAERRKELHETLKEVATEKSRLEKRSFENWREDVINSQVEARAERNGLNVGPITEAERSQMERDATLAIHNEKQDQLLRKRFEYFVENKAPQFKQLLKTLTKKVSPATVREEAKSYIGSLIALEIRPGLFLRAEQKAARDKIAAFNKGDIREAFDAFEREILNRERYREALRALDKIDSIRTYLNRFDEKSVRQDLGKADGDYLDQIDAIMARHDFGVSSRRKIENRRSLREFAKEQEENDLPVIIPDSVLDEASRKSYKEMSLDELEQLRDTVQNIAHLSGLKNELVKGMKRRKLQATAEEVAASVKAHGGEAKEQALETRLPAERLGHKLKTFLASHEKLSMIARQIDGFKDGGLMWEHFVQPFNDAGNQEVEYSIKAAARMKELESDFSTDEKIRMSKLEPVAELGGARLTRWGRIVLALNSGNRDNLIKLAEGLSVSLNRFVSTDDVLAVRDTLTEKELDYVQGILDLLESYKPEVGELHKRVTGLEPKWIEPTPWTSKYGKEYRGGYYPIKYDEQQSSHKVREDEGRSLMEGRFISASTSHAHRIERTKGVRRPILLDRGVIYTALNDVIHDITHYEAVVDADRLIRKSEVHQAINRHYGPEVYGEIRKAILDIAAGDKPTRDAGEDVARFIRRGSVVSMMGWNLVSALQQPFGIATAVPRVGLKNMLAGFSGLGSAKEIEDTDEWIMSNSSFMKNRLAGITMTRELNEVKAQLVAKGYTEHKIDQIIESVTGGKLNTQDIKDSMYYFQVKMQGLADRVIWKAAYKKAMSEADKDAAYPDAHERAVSLADQAVIDTQGSGMVKDRARVERGQGWMQLWTALYSYMNVVLNQNLEALRKTNWKQPESVGRYMADFVFLNTLPILGSMFVFSMLRGDEDDEGFGEKLATEHLAYLIGQFIIFREMQGFIKGYGDYTGPAGASTISNVYRFAGQAKQMEFDEALIRSLNRAAGALLQYPSNQLDRTIRGVRAIVEGETSNPLAPLVGPPARR